MSIVQSRRAAAPDRCLSCPVSHLGLCSWFDSATSANIANRTTMTHFARGTPILIQGEPEARVGVIVSGLAKVVLVEETGEEHLLQLLHPGVLVGDPFATESPFSVEAATDVDLCWLPSSILASAIRQFPAAYRCQLDATTRQANELRFAHVALRGRNALERLAHWILLQIPDDVPSPPQRLQIVLSRRDLASLLEMTVETLCRSLHQLEDRKAIRLLTPETLDVIDRDRLRVLARGKDDRLHDTLLQKGWEWGARPMPARPRLSVVKPVGPAPKAAERQHDPGQ